MAKFCELCQGKLLNISLARCGKCSGKCEWCGIKLNTLNYGQTCGVCKSGELLGKTTQKVGIDRLSKSFLRGLYSDKKGD